MNLKETKLSRKAVQKISEALEAGEHLIAVTVGYLPKQRSNSTVSIIDTSPFNLNAILFVGLSNKNLIIRQEDMFGTVKNIHRIPISNRNWAQLTTEKSFDKLSLIWSGNQRLDLFAFAQLRSESEAIVAVFCANQSQPKNHILQELQSTAYFPPRRKRWNIDSFFILAGFLVGAISILTKNYFPQVGSSLLFGTLAVFFIFLLWGAAGLVWILRREMSQFIFVITGTPAVLFGIFMMLGCWGLAVYDLVLNVPELLR